MFFSKINIERKCVMEEIKFESLNELFNRLYPAFNTKVCELKKSGINVSEVKLWNYLKENKDTSILVITHYPRILEYIKPDYIHVLKDGKIVETGDITLAEKIDKFGYGIFNN